MRVAIWFLFLELAVAAMGAEPRALRPSASISLPGVTGRFDHFATDVAGRRLFVAALGNNTVEVLNVSTNQRLKTITGLRTPQGVAYIPQRNRLVVASGGDGTVRFIDGASYAVEAAISGLDDADNVRIDFANGSEGNVYVGFGDGALAVIDGATAKQTGVIKLDGHPESFQLETAGHRIFVNVPDANHVAVVDRQTLSVVAKWDLKGLRSNFPMALDEANHRLFVGCRRPARLVIMDTADGRRVAELEIVEDTDDVFYDAKHKRIYVAGGEGKIDVIDQRDADHYEVREHVTTSAGARTAFFSPELRTLFLAVPDRAGQTAEIRSYETE